MGVIKKYKKLAKKTVKKRYISKAGGLRKSKIMRDAMMAYKMLNAEKKFLALETVNTSVSQTNGNITGACQFDVTPIPPLGASVNQMSGSSLKLTSSLFQFQVNGLTNCIQKTKLIIDIYKVNGTPINVLTINSGVPLSEIYEPTIFTGIIDANSTRFQNNFSDYTLIRSMSVTLSSEQQAGEIETRTFKMPIKWNRGNGHHIRYANTRTGGTADIDNGQIVMILRADVGNQSGSTISTLNVPVKGVLTGLNVCWAVKHWYYDN